MIGFTVFSCQCNVLLILGLKRGMYEELTCYIYTVYYNTTLVAMWDLCYRSEINIQGIIKHQLFISQTHSVILRSIYISKSSQPLSFSNIQFLIVFEK